MNKEQMKEMKIKEYDHVILEKKQREEQKGTFKIRSLVISDKDGAVNKEYHLEKNEVGLDQTYREALSVDVGEEINITRSKTKRRIKEQMLNRINFQNAIVQIHENSIYKEQKIPVICICEEMLNMINAEYGDEITIDAAEDSDKEKTKAKCMPLTSSMKQRHDELIDSEMDEGNCERKDSNSIHPIFVDSMIREKLNIKKCHPVKIKRSFRGEFMKKLNNLGSFSMVALSVTMIPLISNPEQIIYWALTIFFMLWVVWSTVTASNYKTSNNRF